MRYKFIILFLLIGFVSKAQVYQLMPQYGYSTYRMNFDSTIQIPTFCGVPKLGSNKINKGALAFDSCNNRFYYYNPKSQVWDTIKSADASLFVKYTDTAQMLSAYLRAVDTTNKWVNSVTKLNDSTIQVIKGATTSNITISSVSSATRLITQVWNNTGATILRGSVVYISGRHSSNLPTIALAEGNNEANSYKTFALVDGDILDNSSGFVIQAGKITGLNLPTSSYTDGDILYLSPTIAGGYTTTKPLAPNHIVKLGSVTRAHPTQGSIEIKIENGWQLDELSDVQIASVPLDSTILQFSRVDSLWHDVSPLTAIGNRYLKPTDSVSLSNRINLKLNISDTSAMLSPYMRTNTANASYVTSVFRKTASDSVFFVRGGINNFAFRDSAGGGNIYTTDGTLTGNRTLSVNNNSLTFGGSATASSGFARPYRINPTLNAAANNDTLVGLDINPTFNNSPFGGVSNFGLRVNGTTRLNGRLHIGGQAFLYTGNNQLVVSDGVSNEAVLANNLLAFQTSAIPTIQTNSNVINMPRIRIGSTNSDRSINLFASNQPSIAFYTTSTGQSTSVGTHLQVSTNDFLVSNLTGNIKFQRNAYADMLTLFQNTGNVLIQTGGTHTDVASAILNVNSTSKGFLQPTMTTSQMNAISTPATGLSVFNTTDSAVYIRRGTGAGWQQIANEIVNTASLNFPSTNAQNSSDLTITLTGAVDGDAVVLGVPNAAVNANSCYTAWVSAANTVTVRFNNYSSGAIDPASATFKVTIIK